jgi:hypothetical protein
MRDVTSNMMIAQCAWMLQVAGLEGRGDAIQHGQGRTETSTRPAVSAPAARCSLVSVAHARVLFLAGSVCPRGSGARLHCSPTHKHTAHTGRYKQRTPHVEDELPSVRRKVHRVHLGAYGRDVLLLKLARQVTLYEGRLAYATIPNKHELKRGDNYAGLQQSKETRRGLNGRGSAQGVAVAVAKAYLAPILNRDELWDTKQACGGAQSPQGIRVPLEDVAATNSSSGAGRFRAHHF